MRNYLLIFFFILLFPLLANARPEYAEKTGKDCIFCHVDESGGGLTKEGELFLKTELRPSGLKRVFRILIYYFHFLFGVLWFGTILYVHIILKPSYASKGLPRGELILGWISIVVMGLTGLILTLFRIKDFAELYSTHFGIILSLKIFLYIFMVTSAFVVTFILGPKMKGKNVKASLEKKDKMTIEDLEFFDGKEGRNCYIAYRGEIYDVSNSKLWKNGMHMARHQGGNDLTEALKLAPHNADVLNRFQKIGILVSSSIQKSGPVKLFFVLAYINLVIVFLIIFLITLWKW
ncbi:MAG: cytochrome B5 [Proteobacteria bacterium]|nr:cytochrome B5 [Pseudomonadota bacterium]